MGWAEKLAKELKQRNNPHLPIFFTGRVVSTSPLTVSAFDGQVLLKGQQLKRADPWMKCSAYEICPKGRVVGDSSCNACMEGNCLSPKPLTVGQEVALAGSQTYIIIGVVVGT